MSGGTPFGADDEATRELAPQPQLVPEVEGDAWPARTRSSTLRLRIPTAILLTLLLVALSVWGGAELQKRYGKQGTAAAASSPFGAAAAARFRATGGFSRLGAAGGSGGGTAGTVTLVRGRTIWVTTAGGSLVKVKLAPGATITRTVASSPKGLRLGDTVIVQGTSGAGGTVTASSVRAVQKGVTSGGGGRNGGFGFGGG